MRPHHEEDREERSERGKERDGRVVKVHGTKTSEVVSGLQLYSRYELSVSAFNSKGDGPRSTPLLLSTPEGGESQEPFLQDASITRADCCVSV